MLGFARRTPNGAVGVRGEGEFRGRLGEGVPCGDWRRLRVAGLRPGSGEGPGTPGADWSWRLRPPRPRPHPLKTPMADVIRALALASAASAACWRSLPSSRLEAIMAWRLAISS